MILVTGGTGHLGVPLINELLKRGEQVRVFDKSDAPLSLKNVEIFQGNLLNVEDVKKAMDGVSVIYHLAAIVDYKPAPKKLMYDVIVRGTRNLLEWSRAKKFIFQSTTSVYGRKMKHNPANESTPYRPDSYYAKTKMIAEKLVLQKGGIVVRSPVIYGHGFNDGFEFVLSQIEKGKMQIVGSGDNMIQWIYIDDLIQGLLLAKDRGKPGEVYLLAGKEAKTQRELFELLAKELHTIPPTKRVHKALAHSLAYYKMFSARMMKKESKLTTAHIHRITSNRLFNISKAERELGFSPKVNYVEGAKQIVEEYKFKKHLN